VGINAQLLSFSQTYRSGGISRYILGLLHNLPAASDRYRYTAFVSDPRARRHIDRMDVLVRGAARPWRRILWEQFALPQVARTASIDILHATAFALPLSYAGASTVTVHDLSFIHFPQTFPLAPRLYLKWATRWSAIRATRVIAVSHSTAEDLVSTFGIPRAKISVVANGVSPDLKRMPASESGPVCERLGLPHHFILSVGTVQPRKNLASLLRAYALLRRTTTDLPPLVIAGARGWKDTPLFQLVQDLDLTRHVLFAGYVPPHELAYVYSAASLFVYPSLYEGFGLPALEAMACGAPVITADSSSLPEVVGDAGILVAPRDVDGLAASMRQLLADGELARELASRGVERSRLFSWQRTASETIAVYDLVLGQSQSTDAQDGRPAWADQVAAPISTHDAPIAG
jgi:glycosyltransferase involved in cell wall biosynthesis